MLLIVDLSRECSSALPKFKSVSMIDTYMVRSYILTDKERKIVTSYLMKGKKLDGFRMTKSRIVNLNLFELEADRQLITEFLSKIEKE